MLAGIPPFGRARIEWIVVGLALVLPLVWLTVLDRLLRRTR
jgi:hypothetical protein